MSWLLVAVMCFRGLTTPRCTTSSPLLAIRLALHSHVLPSSRSLCLRPLAVVLVSLNALFSVSHVSLISSVGLSSSFRRGTGASLVRLLACALDSASQTSASRSVHQISFSGSRPFSVFLHLWSPSWHRLASLPTLSFHQAIDAPTFAVNAQLCRAAPPPKLRPRRRSSPLAAVDRHSPSTPSLHVLLFDSGFHYRDLYMTVLAI